MEKFIYWDNSFNDVIIVNLLIVIGLFTCLRLFSGTISHINASKELLKKDNPAFGLSLAGVTFAVTILLSGTIYGDFTDNVKEAAFHVAGLGLLGIMLMALTRYIFDKVSLPDISLRDEITKGNMAVAIADTGNVLAAAIILRSIMIWVTEDNLNGLLAILIAYAISQVILTSITYARRRLFRKFYAGHRMQEELKSGNIAFALSFAGRKIGTAFALGVAANIVVYEFNDIMTVFLPWIVTSIGAIIVLKIISYIAERIILFKIITMREILDDRNIAIGALQAVIYISMAILIAEL